MRNLLLLLAFVVWGCAAGATNPLANIDSATCAQVGGVLGLIMSSAQIAPVVGTSMGAAACSAVAGFFKPQNTLTGTVQMPVQMANVKMTMVNPEPVQCPAGFTCTPK